MQNIDLLHMRSDEVINYAYEYLEKNPAAKEEFYAEFLSETPNGGHKILLEKLEDMPVWFCKKHGIRENSVKEKDPLYHNIIIGLVQYLGDNQVVLGIDIDALSTKLLTREQAVVCFQEAQRAKKNNDEDTLKDCLAALIGAVEGFIHLHLWRNGISGPEREDYMQEAYKGILEHWQDWKPEKGDAWSTYAIRYVVQYTYRYRQSLNGITMSENKWLLRNHLLNRERAKGAKLTYEENMISVACYNLERLQQDKVEQRIFLTEERLTAMLECILKCCPDFWDADWGKNEKKKSLENTLNRLVENLKNASKDLPDDKRLDVVYKIEKTDNDEKIKTERKITAQDLLNIQKQVTSMTTADLEYLLNSSITSLDQPIGQDSLRGDNEITMQDTIPNSNPEYDFVTKTEERRIVERVRELIIKHVNKQFGFDEVFEKTQIKKRDVLLAYYGVLTIDEVREKFQFECDSDGVAKPNRQNLYRNALFFINKFYDTTSRGDFRLDKSLRVNIVDKGTLEEIANETPIWSFKDDYARAGKELKNPRTVQWGYHRRLIGSNYGFGTTKQDKRKSQKSCVESLDEIRNEHKKNTGFDIPEKDFYSQALSLSPEAVIKMLDLMSYERLLEFNRKMPVYALQYNRTILTESMDPLNDSSADKNPLETLTRITGIPVSSISSIKRNFEKSLKEDSALRSIFGRTDNTKEAGDER